MKEIRIYCDRCKKECTDDLYSYHIDLGSPEPLDFCGKCYRSFVITVGDWLKENKDGKDNR